MLSTDSVLEIGNGNLDKIKMLCLGFSCIEYISVLEISNREVEKIKMLCLGCAGVE